MNTNTENMVNKVHELFATSKHPKHGSIEEMGHIAFELNTAFPEAFKAHGETVRFIYNVLNGKVVQ